MTKLYFKIFFILALALILPIFGHDPEDLLPIHSYQNEPSASAEEIIVYRAEVNPLNIFSTCIFILAILHTLFSRKVLNWSKDLSIKNGYSESFSTKILHYLGEVEIIFGFWIIPLLIFISLYYDWQTAIDYLNSRDYTEALFVVVIIILTSSYPIIHLAEKGMKYLASLGNNTPIAWWFTLMTIGPILGSFITEVGAMIITSMLLLKQFYDKKISVKLAYASLGLLFTNISIGGILTTFAAPPVLMVAAKWEWNTLSMIQLFGWKSVLSIILSNLLYFYFFRKEFATINTAPKTEPENTSETKVPLWVTVSHLIFLILVVINLHEPIIFIGLFILFIGFWQATEKYQQPLNLKPALLVGFFFAALIVHGGLQEWWIAPLLQHLDSLSMLGISLLLSPFADNAALAYLATFIPNITEASKYAVMVGAVTAGGLTVIANAANPAAFQVLSHKFPGGISARYLFLGALPAAIIAVVIFFIFMPK